MIHLLFNTKYKEETKNLKFVAEIEERGCEWEIKSFDGIDYISIPLITLIQPGVKTAILTWLGNVDDFPTTIIFYREVIGKEKLSYEVEAYNEDSQERVAVLLNREFWLEPWSHLPRSWFPKKRPIWYT